MKATLAKRNLILFFTVATHILLTSCSYGSEVDKNIRNQRLKKWEKAISQFEQYDSKNSFPKDAVLFVGSSSIKHWATAKSFSDLAVINRGFGGSTIYDVNLFTDRIVIKYRPKVIVFYAGDNDIASNTPPEVVAQNYREFVKKINEALPETRIIFISIKPSKARWSLWPKMQQANSLIKQYCRKDKKLYYLDLATPLLNKDGKPDDNFFVEDKLHLSEKGYAVWTKLLKEQLAAIDQKPHTLITSENFSRIAGMQWILEKMTIDGKKYQLAREKPFVKFAADGNVTGSGSVNRFFGSMKINDKGNIQWQKAFGSTRMAGPEELMKQEDAFLSALPKTEHISIEGIRLYAYSRDRQTEIVFYVPVQ
jgi:heat shock protein HslJ